MAKPEQLLTHPHEELVRQTLRALGDDPTRDGLVDTPARVVRSWAELYSGYRKNPADLFTTFEKGTYDQMVVLREIEFYSTCEHHMLPFVGRATIGYIPGARIVGISKLARLLDVFARRLQVQERITDQVTAALDEHLGPRGSGCIIIAQHMCMTCRGVGKQHSNMVTTSLRGCFRDDPTKGEFLRAGGL